VSVVLNYKKSSLWECM